jgi:hypothetical protein
MVSKLTEEFKFIEADIKVIQDIDSKKQQHQRLDLEL